MRAGAAERLLAGALETAGAPHATLDMQRSIAPRADLRTLGRFARIASGCVDLIDAHSRRPERSCASGSYFIHGSGPLHRTETPSTPIPARVRADPVPRGRTRAGPASPGRADRARGEARSACCGSPSRVRVVNGIAAPPGDPGSPGARARPLRREGDLHAHPAAAGEGCRDADRRVLVDRRGAPGRRPAIAGDGPLRAELEQRARDDGVGHAVLFLGEVSEPIPVPRGADVFVLPSWGESFPYVILEAMSVGLVVAASDVGGVAVAIVDRDSGLLFGARAPRRPPPPCGGC